MASILRLAARTGCDVASEWVRLPACFSSTDEIYESKREA
jgi:hypothetical protein